ncbi:hypothetical protein GE253_03570 [Niveispirillum sp. SYP-B3756]|uniref:hypothetical protein n=1 Tax=Niveispirillum sp. SYP-B3756 TaxID=2662178 RepID=UPI0012926DBB|nr:hypothetical protein [Niveispirillum sp. SYP-B3756]MQP64418.1 hypothetical protein [Niveispirillum sp. SYP-B3756]
MTGSADRRRAPVRALLLAGVALGLLAGPALAQSGAPVPLFPQSRPADPLPASVTPSPDRPSPDPLAAPVTDGVGRSALPMDTPPVDGAGGDAPSPRAPSGMIVEELKAPDPDGVGTLRANEGGFPADLWAGTSRMEAEALLAGIPAGLTSPALRDGTRRLLLSVADLPAGEPAARSLVALRVEALTRIGDLSGADALLDMTNEPLKDEATATAWMELTWLAGDRERACARVGEFLGRFNHASWQKWQMVCQIGAGNTDMALLGIDILREQGDKDDIFFRLTETAAAGQKTPVKGVTEPSPAQLALMLASGRLPPPDLKVAAVGPLAALARAEQIPLVQRVGFAERAAVLGGMEAAALAAFYEQVEGGDAKAMTAAAARKATPLFRAQLVKALRAEPTPAAKAGLFKAAMLAGSTSQQAGTYGRLLLEQTADFRLTVGFAVVAPLVARLALLQDDPKAAAPWITLARDDYNANKDEGAFARLWPLAAAYGLVREVEIDKTRWLRDLGGNAARDQADQVLLILSALERTPDPLPPFADGSPVGGKSKAAVWLDAVALLGPEGVAGAAATDIAEIVANLNRAGLKDQARRIAVEAMATLLRPVG